jgi:hypothetical protein
VMQRHAPSGPRERPPGPAYDGPRGCRHVSVDLRRDLGECG